MVKRNKIVVIVFALCLVALLCVSLVACDHSGNNKKPGDDTNKYEKPVYTVTFNTGSSDMVLTNSKVKVVYGDTVDEPCDANGKKIIPVKRGHEFLFWSKNGSDPFDFDQAITEDTKLTALFQAKKYKHTPMLTSTLKYENGKFTVEQTRDVNDVGLAEAELNPSTTTLLSTFNSSNDKLPCPTGNTTTGEFCFWYYLNDDNEPVQLSKWKLKDESTVGVLSTYNFTTGLTVYPMFQDNLPYVTVKFADSLSGAVYATKEYKFGETIPAGAAVANDKEGYEFVSWYYILTAQDKDGKEVKEEKPFAFETVDEKNPTSPMDAAQAKNNFEPTELTIYAKWTRVIKIESANDFVKLYNELRSEPATEEDKKKKEQIYTAKINILGTIDFGENEYKPLFDKENPFKGTIDGGTTAKIKGGYFGNATDASVFGYNEGTIKNIIFEDVKFNFDDMNADIVYVGAVTSHNGGTIDNCAVVYTTQLDLSYDKGIVYGGITATNNGTKSANALIRLCTINVVGGFTAECKSLVFGGIAGEGNATASITKTTVVSFEVSMVLCAEDSSSKNASLIMGGMVGINGGQIRLSTVKNFNVLDAKCLTEFIFGGVAGINTSNLRVINANVKLGRADAPVKACGSLSNIVSVGGLIGRNSGFILNSYARADLYVEIENAPQNASIVAIGGLVGNNYGDINDSSTATESGVGAINYCYSLGEISVKVAEGIEKVSVYAGGIAGRNKHKKLGSLFSTMNITVNNTGAKNYVGKLVGKMLNDVATNGNLFFIEDVNINVSGEVETQALGTVTDEANFRDGKWVTGADGGTSVIRFSGQTWEVVDNNYPTFKDDVYQEQ